ncbi:hypothetical protein EJ04DRAFT_511208 [Polyplosphaeria fusca]|uniref:Uncharacterized protein n=1 Tax=Polyplosphaeria fusca TaxID=682080 RepID=A0A9P4R3P7_9PLEO|nr:hypothetical protein EJ04DRAFT_511208 [Polyplosphaeria fusca]
MIIGPAFPVRTTLCWIHRSLDFPKDFGRVARNDSEWFDVSRDYTAGSDDTASAQGHAWEYYYVASQPAVFPDMYFFACLRALGSLTHYRIEGMRASVKGNIRPYQGARSNGGQASVEEHGIEVDEDIVPELDIVTVVDMNWWFHPGIIIEELVVFFR